MYNPDRQSPQKIENKIVLSQELIDIKASYKELEELEYEDFSQNQVLTKELSEQIIKKQIKKKRFWNLFVEIAAKANYQPPQDRKTQILDLACSVCEEKEALHSFFGGEENPYYNNNDNAIITGIDIDEDAIELVKKYLPSGREKNFNFITGDASDLKSINGIPEKADVVLIRHQQMIKPNYNKNDIIETELWEKIIKQGIERLDKNGIFIITSYTDDEHRALLDFLRTTNTYIVTEGENKFAELLGAGGIDKYFVVIKLKEDKNE